jgi:hypothetical protein
MFSPNSDFRDHHPSQTENSLGKPVVDAGALRGERAPNRKYRREGRKLSKSVASREREATGWRCRVKLGFSQRFNKIGEGAWRLRRRQDHRTNICESEGKER